MLPPFPETEGKLSMVHYILVGGIATTIEKLLVDGDGEEVVITW